MADRALTPKELAAEDFMLREMGLDPLSLDDNARLAIPKIAVSRASRLKRPAKIEPHNENAAVVGAQGAAKRATADLATTAREQDKLNKAPGEPLATTQELKDKPKKKLAEASLTIPTVDYTSKDKPPMFQKLDSYWLDNGPVPIELDPVGQTAYGSWSTALKPQVSIPAGGAAKRSVLFETEAGDPVAGAITGKESQDKVDDMLAFKAGVTAMRKHLAEMRPKEWSSYTPEKQEEIVQETFAELTDGLDGKGKKVTSGASTSMGPVDVLAAYFQSKWGTDAVGKQVDTSKVPVDITPAGLAFMDAYADRKLKVKTRRLEATGLPTEEARKTAADQVGREWGGSRPWWMDSNAKRDRLVFNKGGDEGFFTSELPDGTVAETSVGYLGRMVGAPSNIAANLIGAGVARVSEALGNDDVRIARETSDLAPLGDTKESLSASIGQSVRKNRGLAEEAYDITDGMGGGETAQNYAWWGGLAADILLFDFVPGYNAVEGAIRGTATVSKVGDALKGLPKAAQLTTGEKMRIVASASAAEWFPYLSSKVGIDAADARLLSAKGMSDYILARKALEAAKTRGHNADQTINSLIETLGAEHKIVDDALKALDGSTFDDWAKNMGKATPAIDEAYEAYRGTLSNLIDFGKKGARSGTSPKDIARWLQAASTSPDVQRVLASLPKETKLPKVLLSVLNDPKARWSLARMIAQEQSLDLVLAKAKDLDWKVPENLIMVTPRTAVVGKNARKRILEAVGQRDIAQVIKQATNRKGSRFQKAVGAEATARRGSARNLTFQTFTQEEATKLSDALRTIPVDGRYADEIANIIDDLKPVGGKIAITTDQVRTILNLEIDNVARAGIKTEKGVELASLGEKQIAAMSPANRTLMSTPTEIRPGWVYRQMSSIVSTLFSKGKRLDLGILAPEMEKVVDAIKRELGQAGSKLNTNIKALQASDEMKAAYGIEAGRVLSPSEAFSYVLLGPVGDYSGVPNIARSRRDDRIDEIFSILNNSAIYKKRIAFDLFNYWKPISFALGDELKNHPALAGRVQALMSQYKTKLVSSTNHGADLVPLLREYVAEMRKLIEDNPQSNLKVVGEDSTAGALGKMFGSNNIEEIVAGIYFEIHKADAISRQTKKLTDALYGNATFAERFSHINRNAKEFFGREVHPSMKYFLNEPELMKNLIAVRVQQILENNVKGFDDIVTKDSFAKLIDNALDRVITDKKTGRIYRAGVAPKNPDLTAANAYDNIEAPVDSVFVAAAKPFNVTGSGKKTHATNGGRILDDTADKAASFEEAANHINALHRLTDVEIAGFADIIDDMARGVITHNKLTSTNVSQMIDVLDSIIRGTGKQWEKALGEPTLRVIREMVAESPEGQSFTTLVNKLQHASDSAGYATAMQVGRALDAFQSWRYAFMLSFRPRFHGVNFLTAPLIMASTIGMASTAGSLTNIGKGIVAAGAGNLIDKGLDKLAALLHTHKALGVISLDQARESIYLNRIAVTDPSGRFYTYGDILRIARESGALKSQASSVIGKNVVNEIKDNHLSNPTVASASRERAESILDAEIRSASHSNSMGVGKVSYLPTTEDKAMETIKADAIRLSDELIIFDEIISSVMKLEGDIRAARRDVQALEKEATELEAKGADTTFKKREIDVLNGKIRDIGADLNDHRARFVDAYNIKRQPYNLSDMIRDYSSIKGDYLYQLDVNAHSEQLLKKNDYRFNDGHQAIINQVERVVTSRTGSFEEFLVTVKDIGDRLKSTNDPLTKLMGDKDLYTAYVDATARWSLDKIINPARRPGGAKVFDFQWRKGSFIPGFFIPQWIAARIEAYLNKIPQKAITDSQFVRTGLPPKTAPAPFRLPSFQDKVGPHIGREIDNNRKLITELDETLDTIGRLDNELNVLKREGNELLLKQKEMEAAGLDTDLFDRNQLNPHAVKFRDVFSRRNILKDEFAERYEYDLTIINKGERDEAKAYVTNRLEIKNDILDYTKKLVDEGGDIAFTPRDQHILETMDRGVDIGHSSKAIFHDALRVFKVSYEDFIKASARKIIHDVTAPKIKPPEGGGKVLDFRSRKGSFDPSMFIPKWLDDMLRKAIGGEGPVIATKTPTAVLDTANMNATGRFDIDSPRNAEAAKAYTLWVVERLREPTPIPREDWIKVIQDRMLMGRVLTSPRAQKLQALENKLYKRWSATNDVAAGKKMAKPATQHMSDAEIAQALKGLGVEDYKVDPRKRESFGMPSDMNPAVIGAEVLKKLPAAKNFLNDFAEANDQAFRIAAIMHSLSIGEDIQVALMKGQKALFDYSALTDFERKIIQPLVMFWSFKTLSFRTFFYNLTKNPSRLANQIKLNKGIPGVTTPDESKQDSIFYPSWQYGRAITSKAEGYINLSPPVPMADAFIAFASVLAPFEKKGAGGRVDTVINEVLRSTSPEINAILVGLGAEEKEDWGIQAAKRGLIDPADVANLKAFGMWSDDAANPGLFQTMIGTPILVNAKPGSTSWYSRDETPGQTYAFASQVSVDPETGSIYIKTIDEEAVKRYIWWKTVANAAGLGVVAKEYAMLFQTGEEPGYKAGRELERSPSRVIGATTPTSSRSPSDVRTFEAERKRKLAEKLTR